MLIRTSWKYCNLAFLLAHKQVRGTSRVMRGDLSEGLLGIPLHPPALQGEEDYPPYDKEDDDEDSLVGAPLGRAFFATSLEADEYYEDDCYGDGQRMDSSDSNFSEWHDDLRSKMKRRLVLWGAFAILFTRYCVATLQLAFFPQFALYVGIRLSSVGAIFTAYPLGMSFTWLIGPLLIHRIGTKWATILALLVTAAATLLFGLLPDIADLTELVFGIEPSGAWRGQALAIGFFLCQCVNGLIGGVAESAAIAVVSSSYAETPFLGPVMAAIGTVCGLGCMVGPPLGGLLYSLPMNFAATADADQDGWAFRLPFLALCGVALLLVAVAALVVPQEHIVEEKRVRWKTHCAPLRRVISPSFVLSLVAVLVSSLVVSTLDTCLAIRLGAFVPSINHMNLAPYVVGLFFSAPSIVYLVASIPVGWLIEKFGENSRVFKMIQAAGFGFIALSFGLLGPIWLPDNYTAWFLDAPSTESGNTLPAYTGQKFVGIALIVVALVLKGVGSAGSNAA